MATPATTAPIAAAATDATSSYREKLKTEPFPELVEIAEPKIIYRSGRIHFFPYDGFVMHIFECKNGNFKSKVLHAIEFSNRPWDE